MMRDAGRKGSNRCPSADAYNPAMRAPNFLCPGDRVVWQLGRQLQRPWLLVREREAATLNNYCKPISPAGLCSASWFRIYAWHTMPCVLFTIMRFVFFVLEAVFRHDVFYTGVRVAVQAWVALGPEPKTNAGAAMSMCFCCRAFFFGFIFPRETMRDLYALRRTVSTY